MAKINGSSFALQYKRTTSRPIDSTDVWDTIEDARVYARNTDTEAYVPYAGQVISVLENGAIYKLVKDDSIPETDGKKHFKLAMIGSNNDNDDRYLRKNAEDTAAKLIHFLEGIDAKGVSTLEEINLLRDIVSKNFANGSTGFGIYQDESGNYHLDIDFVNIRRKLTVEEIQVQQSSYIGGKQWNTAAGIICNRVEDKGTAWRCYFRTTDAEGRVVRNTFATGDQAICETFNLDRQAGGTLGNHYYWRLVTARGDDYIDLSKTDCDAGSDTPRAGDNIVQLGNRTDASRQGAICWDSVTDGGPYVRVFRGINSYYLPEPSIDLNPEKSTIKAKLVSEATGKDVDETFNSLQADMNLVREQADREYTIWFFEYVPTLSNVPASQWNTDELRRLHDQDLFYNKSTGLCYRFERNADGSYGWNSVTDQFTVKALENAAKAQDTADGKRRVFVSQPTADMGYDVGDLWVDATYSGGGVTYSHDSLVCITAKAKGAAFSISHWKPTSTATTAVIQNLGDRITQVVSDLGDTDVAVADAERLASQGIDDARDAYLKAQEALGIAQDADSAAYVNATVIQQTKESITALANRISFDSNGNIANIKTSGLVTTADFAALTGKEIVYDKNGHVDMTKTAGVVTTANFAQIFSERATADGYVKRAEISTFITEDDAGRLISGATIQADQIDFLGKTVINGKFVVDANGSVTMNDFTANSGTFNGTVNAERGTIAGFRISGNGISNADASGSYANDAYVIFRNDPHGCFAGIGGNVLPATTGARGVARFENHDENDWWGLGHNYAMIVSARGASDNTAIQINGGYISGLAYKTDNVVSSKTLGKDVVDVACVNNALITITLPVMDVYDDGHVIRIKRLNGASRDGLVRLRPGYSYHRIFNESTQRIERQYKPTYLHVEGSDHIYPSGYLAIESVGDAMEFVYHRDINNGTQYGAWVQYKNPPRW